MVVAGVAAAVDAGAPPLRPYSHVAGGAAAYTVMPGETLALIAARQGVTVDALARSNGLKESSRLAPGLMLQVDNSHIVVAREDAAIVINLPQRMLFLSGPTRTAAYPVGVGRSDWPTPTGRFRILVKEEHPTWEVPPSIQEEMRSKGQRVITTMPPCPENPLGDHWLGLSLPGIGIHGTIAPLSIYRTTTHGCVRMHPDDIQTVFADVEVGTAGEIVYEPLLVAVSGDLVFLEAHRDVYRRLRGAWEALVRQSVATAGCRDGIDWESVRQVIRKKDGVARAVGTCAAGSR
jgi:L,D-transpeptidase ErfK/SrfK